jgi:hypothetical protein
VVNLCIEQLATKTMKEITRLEMRTVAFTFAKYVCGGSSFFTGLYVHLLQMQMCADSADQQKYNTLHGTINHFVG